MPTIVCTVVFEKDDLHLPFCGNGPTEYSAFVSAMEQDSMHLQPLLEHVPDGNAFDFCAKIWHEGRNQEDFKQAFGAVGYTVHILYNNI